MAALSNVGLVEALVEKCLTKGLQPSVEECLTSMDARGPSRKTGYGVRGQGVRGRQGGRPRQGRGLSDQY